MATTFEGFKETALYRAMVNRGDYGSEADIKDAFDSMRQRLAEGEDPEEILYDEGFEPDYIFDIM